MTESIGLEKLRRNLSDVMGKVRYGHVTYVIESYGQPTAVLLSIDKYRQLTGRPSELRERPARIFSPRLTHPADAEDFRLEVVPDDASDA